jgi:ribosomal protein L10
MAIRTSKAKSSTLSDRINRLPKWARDYIHHVHTFVGAEEVEELTQLRDERRLLVKLVTELKAENRQLKRRLESSGGRRSG